MVRAISCNFCDSSNFGSEVDMVIHDVRKDAPGKKAFNLVVLSIKIQMYLNKYSDETYKECNSYIRKLCYFLF